jgi:hypothetical protein
MKGMRGLCVTVKAELEEMSPKVCALFKREFICLNIN